MTSRASLLHLVLLVAPLVAANFINEPGGEDWRSVISDLVKHSKHQENILEEYRSTIRKLQDNINVLNGRVQQLETQEAEQARSRAAVPRTCEEIRRANSTSPSGSYSIDPDGDGTGDPPITVYCNMTTGATLVSHDSESIAEAEKCANPGCYSRPINYNATLRQVSALVQQSKTCKQAIRFDCLGVPLEFNDVAQGWWDDVRGVPQYYWAGSNAALHTCQCGIDKNCVDNSLKCNCDSLAFYELFDAGVITEKSALPVTKLNFGRTIAPSTFGRHTLGKLECSGREVDDRIPESCDDLWKIGYTLNGIFAVKSNGQVQSVYCDFSKTPGEEGQTLIGTMDVKSTPVYFHVQRNSTFSTSGSNETITFNIEILNEGGAMDLGSGIFIAPKAGTYFFAFSGVKYYSSQFYVSLNLNDVAVSSTASYGFSNSYEYEISMSLVSTLNLEEGDEVYLSASGRYLLESPGRRYTQFTGILLQEKIAF